VISQIVAGLATIALAASPACEAKKQEHKGQPASLNNILVNNGSLAITKKFHPTIRATSPTKSCTYWLYYDIPNPTPNNDVVEVLRVHETKGILTVNLGTKYGFTYTDNKTGKLVIKRHSRPTRFVTKGCGNWRKK
jgi:hypothetical protein